MALILETLSNTSRDEVAAPYSGDPAFDAVRQLLLTEAGTRGGVAHFSVAGVPYMAQISPVEFSGLLKGNTLVIAAPVDDFVGPSNRLLIKTLMIAGGVLVAGIVAALVVARLISNALFSLAAEARQIGDLDFKGQGAYRSMIAEINILANALAAARDAIRNFSLYVPRELVRKIVSAGKVETGVASRQDVTLLFTDIRDFTTISEQYSPESVTALLSSYFQLDERYRGAAKRRHRPISR
jgi:adenylate cyclase